MDLLDIEIVQLAYLEKLRNAEQERRPLFLGYEPEEQAPVERVNGLRNVIKQWLHARTRHQEVRDTRQSHAV